VTSKSRNLREGIFEFIIILLYIVSYKKYFKHTLYGNEEVCILFKCFRKISLFQIMEKILQYETSHRRKYNTAHELVCWISNVTNTQSEYLKLFDFQQQQPLRESTSMLSYKYIVYLVLVLIEN